MGYLAENTSIATNSKNQNGGRKNGAQAFCPNDPHPFSTRKTEFVYELHDQTYIEIRIVEEATA